MPNQNQLNRTICTSVTTNFNDILNNFKFIDSLCNVTDAYNKITDLMRPDADSDVQQLLESNKTIIDNLVARGIVKISLVNSSSPSVNTFKTIFYLQFISAPNVSSDLNLYEVDLSFFYTVNNAEDGYEPTSNALTYASQNNASYIHEVTEVKKSIEKLIDLVASLKDSF